LPAPAGFFIDGLTNPKRLSKLNLSHFLPETTDNLLEMLGSIFCRPESIAPGFLPTLSGYNFGLYQQRASPTKTVQFGADYWNN